MPSAVRLSVLTLLVLVAAVPAALGAFGDRGVSYSVHDHATKGKNWHVEVVISEDTRRIATTVVVYEQMCDATPVMTDVAVDLKGRINISQETFKLPKKAGQGTWSMLAQFTSEHELVGTYRIITPTCDTGVRLFRAHAGGHEHGAGSSHHSGTRPGKYPDLAAAPPEHVEQARTLWRDSREVAARMFPTYSAARAEHYWRYPLKWKRPLLFHLRHDGHDDHKTVLEPEKVESLVYWWPKRGEPILIGFMYRAPLKRKPPFAGDLLAWHSHIEDGRQGDNQMTHVWLTGDLRSALANCLPVAALQKAIPRFRYSKPAHGAGHESRRCRDTR